MAVFLGILIFWLVESNPQSTDSLTTTTYTTPLEQNKPTMDKPVPYFVYEGALDLEKLKRDEELLLCQGGASLHGRALGLEADSQKRVWATYGRI